MINDEQLFIIHLSSLIINKIGLQKYVPSTEKLGFWTKKYPPQYSILKIRFFASILNQKTGITKWT